MKLDEPTEDSSVLLWRVVAMTVVVVVFFLVIGVRLWFVQIRQGAEFTQKSLENFVQVKRMEHSRGEIVDREGRVLVTNRASVNVTVTPAFLPATSRMVRDLGKAARLSRAASDGVAAALVRSAEESGPPVLLARDLALDDARTLRRAAADLDLALEVVPIIEMPEARPPAMRYAAYLDPEHFPSTHRVLGRLKQLMDLSDGEFVALKTRVQRSRGLDRYLDVIVRRDVSPDIEGRLSLEIQLGELPGVEVRTAKTRHYRHGDTGAHLLGYVNELSPTELEARRELGYRLGDSIGRRGIEQAFEEDLRGTDGYEAVVVDSKGREQHSGLALSLKEEVGIREAPRPGNRVVLTVDADLQEAAEKAFSGKAGAVVVMEVDTGRILALTSTPSFEPNLVTGYFDPVERKRLLDLGLMRPWRFRAIQDHFAPGSTFKVVTALAALSGRATTEHEVVHCGGAFRLGNTRFRCWKDAGHGGVTVVWSLAKSCDVFYYTMGARIGLDAIAAVGLDLGFGSRTGIAISGEAHGIMPTEDWYEKHLPEGYTTGAAVNASIGQGAVTVTPLQLAVAYAAIANGGVVWEPQVALRLESYDGSAVREIAPKERRRLKVTKEALSLVQDGLRKVVNDPNGTAYKRRIQEMEVSGKTGTAQVAKLGAKRLKVDEVPWELRDHAWFAAYAPSLNPEIVIVVLNEHGGGGSSAAAPTAMAIASAWHAKKQQRVEGAWRAD